MKKVLILAAMFGMFAACGGPKDVKDMTPVEKYNYYQESMQKALEAGEYQKLKNSIKSFITGTDLLLRKKRRS